MEYVPGPHAYSLNFVISLSIIFSQTHNFCFFWSAWTQSDTACHTDHSVDTKNVTEPCHSMVLGKATKRKALTFGEYEKDELGEEGSEAEFPGRRPLHAAALRTLRRSSFPPLSKERNLTSTTSRVSSINKAPTFRQQIVFLLPVRAIFTPPAPRSDETPSGSNRSQCETFPTEQTHSDVRWSLSCPFSRSQFLSFLSFSVSVFLMRSRSLNYNRIVFWAAQWEPQLRKPHFVLFPHRRNVCAITWSYQYRCLRMKLVFRNKIEMASFGGAALFSHRTTEHTSLEGKNRKFVRNASSAAAASCMSRTQQAHRRAPLSTAPMVVNFHQPSSCLCVAAAFSQFVVSSSKKILQLQKQVINWTLNGANVSLFSWNWVGLRRDFQTRFQTLPWRCRAEKDLGTQGRKISHNRQAHPFRNNIRLCCQAPHSERKWIEIGKHDNEAKIPCRLGGRRKSAQSTKSKWEAKEESGQNTVTVADSAVRRVSGTNANLLRGFKADQCKLPVDRSFNLEVFVDLVARGLFPSVVEMLSLKVGLRSQRAQTFWRVDSISGDKQLDLPVGAVPLLRALRKRVKSKSSETLEENQISSRAQMHDRRSQHENNTRKRSGALLQQSLTQTAQKHTTGLCANCSS